jgi:hypothetical protein
MNITEDGTHELFSLPDNNYSAGIVYIAGTSLGTATAILNFADASGNLSPYENGELTLDSQNRVEHGRDAQVVLVVAGANGSTDFNVFYKGSYS